MTAFFFIHNAFSTKMVINNINC